MHSIPKSKSMGNLNMGANNMKFKTRSFVDIPPNPLEFIGMESTLHISFKVAHECSLAFPEVEFPFTGEIDDKKKNLALCLATPDDTITPENKIESPSIVRPRSRPRPKKNEIQIN